MSSKKLPQTLDKPSECIHVNHDLSGPAQALYNCLLAYVFDDIERIADVPEFAVPQAVVKDYLRTRNTKAIKEWLKELRRTDFEFNNVGKGGPSWGLYGFIEHPEMRGEYITFGMAPTLRSLIADSNMFAKINLLVERKFKRTKYSMPLYELGLDYRNHRDRVTGKAVTPWFTPTEFCEYMGAPEDTPFKLLNRNIIKKALKEINAESNIRLTADFDRVGRKVERLRFIIEDNPVNQSVTERIERIQATLPDLDGSAGIEQAKYAEMMVRMFGIYKAKARKLACLFVRHSDHFQAVTDRIERGRLAGEPKGEVAPWAAKIYEQEGMKRMGAIQG